MAYTLKYYKTLSQPDGSNILLEIYEKDGTGASKEIGPVIQILRMDIQGSQNDIDTPIVKTSLTMTFVDAPDHEESSSKKCGNWEEFYTPDSTYWKVVLKSDSSSGSFRQIWGGYVTPDSFSEQLRYRGSVTIIARDNIGHLQDFPFDAEGNEDGMITVYDLVNAAWAKIGSPMSLDWRGEEDNALWLQCDGTDAPSAYMNVSAFEGKNWYEAVDDVLHSMGMAMRYVGNNTVQVSSLRYMQYQGKGDMSALPRIEPKFVAHAQRELAPAAKRIEESVRFELTDGKLAPLADGVLFTGLKGTSPFISENVFGEEAIYDIPVWPIANIGDLGWSNVQSRTLFIDPSQYTLSGDMADDAKRMIFIAGNTGNSRAVSFGQRMACRDFRIELQFGRVAERMNNRLSYAWFVWPARFRGYLSVLQNGITQYYNGSGWQAAEYLIDEEIVEGMFAMDVPLSKFVGSAIVKLTIQEIVIGWNIGDVSDGQGLYVAVSSLKSAPIKSSLLETNRVNTNYDETNNVIIKRDPSLAPAYNEVPFPQVIKNGIFLIQDGAYVPAKEWAWPGGTPHQMAVYNHLQLLCYYAKPNNVITGDIINADLGDIRALYVWEGKEHLLQGGSLNFLNGRIEGAILREFTRYESLWGAMTRSVAMPEVEESSTTNLESGSSPASDSYDINTEVYLGGGGGTIVIDKAMSDTSQNAVENRVIKAYIDAGDNLIKEEIERLKQQTGADTPSSFYHDMAAIVSHTGMITRQTREQLYNIFTYTEGDDISSEPAWVIDTNGQHYIVRMLQTETGVGFFIIGYEGYTRIEGDNTKTNQLLRDKADKKYVDGTFFSQAQFDSIASSQYVVGSVAYQTDSDTGLRRLSLSLGLRIQNDIDAAVNDRPDDNGNYTNGLVTALGVKNWVENKGYLTSAAMNGYLPLSGGTMDRGAGIFNGANPNTTEGAIGFNTTHNAFGSTTFPTKIRSSVNPTIKLPADEYDILHSGNFTTFGIANMSNNATGSANDILTSSVYGIVDSLTDIPIYYGNLLTFAARNAHYQSQLIINYKSEMAIRGRDGSWSDWARVVTDENFATYGIKAGVLKTTGSANDLTVPSIAGDVESLQDVPFHYCNILTITTTPHYYVGQLAIDYNGRMATRGQDGSTWSAWRTVLDTTNIASYAISSNGGTINKDKYLYFGDASLAYKTTADGFTKLVISGLTEVGNLYVRERIWMEMNSDSRFGFRNSSTGESQSISSFSDLKTILSLGSLAYKDEAEVAKVCSEQSNLDFNDLVTTGSYTIIGGTNTHHPMNYGTLLTIHGKSSYFMSQVAIQYNGQMYVRAKGDSAGADGDYWAEWRTVVDSSNVSDYALPKTGGTITGNLVLGASLHGAVPSGGTFYGYSIYKSGDILYILSVKGNGIDKNGSIQLGGNGTPAEEIILYASSVKLTGVLKLSYGFEIGGFEKLIMGGGNIEGVGAILHKNAGAYHIDANGNLYVDASAESSYWQVKMTNGASALTVYAGTGRVETIKDTTIARYGGTVNIGYSTHPATTNIYGALSVIGGAASFQNGITLGDETINSWAEVRSNWGWRYTSLNNQTIEQIDINVRQKTTIITTLTADHTLTFNLLIEANVMNEWLIVFTTGTTVPKIGISRGSNPLYWQNKQNILNNLSPNTTYRIYVDSDMAMYETF